jgi:hypothetical protein
LGHHAGQQSAVEPHGRHQVLVQFLRPLRVVQGCKAASRCARAAKHVDEDINAAFLLEHRLRHLRRAFGCREVSGDVADTFG